MRRLLLFAVALIACRQEILPADCPSTTRSIEGVCRVNCAGDADCLYSESCLNQACIPRSPNEGPRVRLFQADRILVTRQDPIVHFDYVVTNASEVDLAPMPGSLSEHAGTIEVAVGSSTDFQLIGRGQDQRQDSALQHVELVEDPPPGELLVSMTADRSQLEPCGAVDVQWTVVGDIQSELQVWIVADGVEEVFRGFERSGTITLTLDRRRVLQMYAEAGEASGVSAEVTSRPGKLCSLTAQPERVTIGDTALLQWEARGAALVYVEDADSGQRLFTQVPHERLGRIDGRWLVAPVKPTTYRVVAEGVASEFDDELTVQIETTGEPPPPIIHAFTVRPPWFPTMDILEASWSTQDGASNTILWNGTAESVQGAEGSTTRLAQESTEVWLLSERDGLTSSARAKAWAASPEIEPNDLPAVANQMGDFAYHGNFDLLNLDVDRYRAAGGAPLRIEIFDPLQIDCNELNGARLVVEIEGDVLYEETIAGLCPSLIVQPRQTGDYLISLFSPPSIGNIENAEYVLAADPAPVTCGDLAIELAERCDDGNQHEGDGCSAECSLEPGYEYEVLAGDGALPPVPGGAVSLEFVPYLPDGDATNEGFAIVPADLAYFGHRYAGLMVHVNGYVTLLPDLTVEAGIGSPRPPNALIAAFGTDLNNPNGISILYWSDFTPAGARHVVAYREVFGQDGQGMQVGPISFDIEIYDSGEIHFYYDTQSFFPPGYPWFGGIESGTGQYFHPLKDCGELCFNPPESSAVGFLPR